MIHKPHNLTVSNSVLELGDSEESLPQREQRWTRQILNTECDYRIPKSDSEARFELENSSLSYFNLIYIPSDLIAEHDSGQALKPVLVDEGAHTCLAGVLSVV